VKINQLVQKFKTGKQVDKDGQTDKRLTQTQHSCTVNQHFFPP